MALVWHLQGRSRGGIGARASGKNYAPARRARVLLREHEGHGHDQPDQADHRHRNEHALDQLHHRRSIVSQHVNIKVAVSFQLWMKGAALPSHDAANDHQADGCDNRQRRERPQREHHDLVFCFPIHCSISCCWWINNAELDHSVAKELDCPGTPPRHG